MQNKFRIKSIDYNLRTHKISSSGVTNSNYSYDFLCAKVNEREASISSIENVATREVFSVGDEICRSQKEKIYNTIKEIKKVEPREWLSESEKKVLFDFGTPACISEKFECNRFEIVGELIFPNKKLLFTSTDGSPIYWKDRYWDTHGDYWKPRARVAELGDKGPTAATPKFKIKRNAKKYITENQPRFSLQNLKDSTTITISSNEGMNIIVVDLDNLTKKVDGE